MLVNGSNVSGGFKVPEYLEDKYEVIGIAENAFYANNNITSIDIHYGIEEIGRGAFALCGKLKSVKLSAFKYGYYFGEALFKDCKSLEKVELPNDITFINSQMFDGCSNLLNITLPNSLESIGNYAFRGCGITQIDIPNSLIDIGTYAFANCTNLKSLKFSEKLERIGVRAFENCINLTSVTFANKDKPYCSISALAPRQEVIFVNCHKDLVVYVPVGCSAGYKKALNLTCRIEEQ